MLVIYNNLNGEIARRQLRKTEIAESLGISYRSFRNKMIGVAPWTWDEAVTIQRNFFPDLSKDYLFATGDEKGA